MSFRKHLIRLTVILMLAVIAVTAYTRYKVSQLEKDLSYLSLPGFTLSSQHPEISILNQSATLSHPSVKARLAVDSLTLQAEQIAIYGLHLPSYIFRGKIQADSLVLQAPQITLKKQKDTVRLPKTEKKPKKKPILLHGLHLTDGTTYRISETTDTTLAVKNINLFSTNLEIDPLQPEKSSLLNYEVALSEIQYEINTLNDIHVESILLKNGIWKILGIAHLPKYNKSTYTKHLPYQDDRIALTVDSIVIAEPNPLFLRDSMFKALSVDVYRAQLDVFRDKFLPRKDKYKPMITALVRQSPVQPDIDSLRIHNSSLQYGELVNTNGVIGEIQITDIHLRMGPVRTLPQDTTQMVFTARIMEEGLVEGIGSFPIQDKNDRFSTTLHLSGLHYQKLNAFTSPNMNVVNTGFIKDAFITIHGNETKATGHVLMNYKDFKLTLMNKKGNKEKKILSAVANALIHKERVDKQQKSFEVERNKERSFFNYMWLCVQKAMVTAML